MDPQRIPQAYWRQRLRMARAMGLNTVFSYVFWNELEPARGRWDFSGRNDVARFFRIADEEGLKVVLRPGPYVCGEREWGGFPAWLMMATGGGGDEPVRVREDNGPFLEASRRYLRRLGAELRDLQATRGGPVLMVQLENEYGSFGSDKKYLQALADMLRESFDLRLYTNDGDNKANLENGQLHGVLAETDGDPRQGFAARDKYVTDKTSLGPQLDGEYYVTWFDDWSASSGHHAAPGNGAAVDKALDGLEWVLRGNNSFSIYMFHGGTNWGFGNGAIWANGRTMAVTSSYDYGAPLDESGRPTEIYFKLRAMISKYVPAGSIPEVPKTPPLIDIKEFSLKPARPLFDTRSRQPDKRSSQPATMESLAQSYGFVLYEHKVAEDASGILSPGDEPRDRVMVYVNGKRVGVVDRTYVTPAKVRLSLKRGDTLQLLVENLGRVDFTHKLKDQRKGIVGNVSLGSGRVLEGWSMYSLSLDALPPGIFTNSQVVVRDEQPPVFYTASFRLPAGSKTGFESDTFLSLPRGTKGQVWVNGINLGRYWAVGPQQSLYLPGCYLKTAGQPNEVVVLELEPRASAPPSAKGISVRQWFNSPDPDAP
ncbi:hypothetical protein CDD83_8866 [Cordyceps sp. RAO-2017]|nr:hypothetical protein CDD83_8866 [Cordyceps sp. RAO-2017]